MSSYYQNNRYSTNNNLQPQPVESINYRSSNFYPVPEPKNIYRLNPVVLSTLKNIDVDDVQKIFGKGIQDQNMLCKSEILARRRLFNESQDIRNIKNAITEAKVNQLRAQQIRQNQALRMNRLIKDSEADEQILQRVEDDKKYQQEMELKKRAEANKIKNQLLDQIKEKEIYNYEAKKEYERDLQNVKELMEKIKQEDYNAYLQNQRKKAINKQYMESAYAAKAKKLQEEKEYEEFEKEKARQYNEQVAKREGEHNAKRAAIQEEKDRIFNKLSAEKAASEAEKDYWENVRNELYLLKEEKKNRLRELEEQQRRQKQKEDILNMAIEQMKLKAAKKAEEDAMEEEFKKQLEQKYREDEEKERLYNYNRKLREQEFKDEVERLWKIRLEQFRAQKAQELAELEQQKKEEEVKSYLIEQEKKRLIKENEELLQKFNQPGYQRSINSLASQKIPTPKNLSLFTNTKHDVIYNNIFGNSNPNPSTAYPKWGNIKNFVYDINIQDVHPKINRENHLMYNATLNNDFDSYPTQEEYKSMMQKTGQTRYAYAGGVAKPGASFVKMLNTNNLGISAGSNAARQVDTYAKSITNNNIENINNNTINENPILSQKITTLNNNDFANNSIGSNMTNTNTINASLINENNNNYINQPNNNLVEENNNNANYNQYKNAEAELI
jgi:hypothetical protein